MTVITYHVIPDGVNWPRDIERLIGSTGVQRIADLGAGAHPVLTPDYVMTRNLEYTLFDVSEPELGKADSRFVRSVADVTSEGFSPTGDFDLVLSRWFLEHIADPRQLHKNVFRMLRPGGRAVHFFPTLYALPFVLNALLPERASGRVLRASFEDRMKFQARYRWCRGPTRRQIRRFEELGFTVERYTGFFGHPYYSRVPVADVAEKRLARFLVTHPVPALTTFALLVLAKPAS